MFVCFAISLTAITFAGNCNVGMVQQAVEHRGGNGLVARTGGVPSPNPAFILILVGMKIAPCQDMGLIASSSARPELRLLHQQSSVAKGGLIFLAAN